ncbi:MAG: glycosyl hydrolase, partial [Muriicola sp.]|nr:glycosyl hydrolase [Muriicola sp.]
IHKGLPEEKGKMAIAVSQANPQKVYALIESDSDKDLGGLFVSNDAGASWTMVSGDNRLVQRAWYYIEVFTDPNNDNIVYVMSAQALRSIDGGNTWEEITGTHGDYHDLWINPDDSRNMIIANDGGAAISFDYAKTWTSQDIMPTAQFYRINTDRLFPYNIYGGQQDNSSVRIPHLSLSSSGIGERDWTSSAGGESAFLAFDPDNPRYVMGGSYLGYIDLLDTQTKSRTKVLAAPIQYLGMAARDMKYLFNWNAPIVRSQHEDNTFFHGAQMVLRTRDMGVSWEEISPDLTRNMDDKQGKGGGPYTVEAVGAENYGTISYMIESPHEKGVYWTGSDDGFVHITRDGGNTWQNVTPKGLKECLVNAIEVSPHSPGTAYIATTRYKFNDYTPALYKTKNYGQSWTQISSGIPYGSFTRVVREDTGRAGLLYAGTEKGLFISWNDGSLWEPFQLNLPNTPITDLKVHQGDLIVATSGRSFWILDDLAVLAQYKPVNQGLKLYRPENALNASWSSPLNGNSKKFSGSQPLVGVNPANGMVIYYELPRTDINAPIIMEIRNSQGKLIRSFSSEKDMTYQEHNGGGPPPKPVLTKDQGLNRFVWDLNYPIMEGIPGVYMEAGFEGHKAPPGDYEIKLTLGEESVNTQASILSTPGFEVSQVQYEEFDSFMSEMEAELSAMHLMVNQLYNVQGQLKNVLKSLEAGPLKESGQKLLNDLTSWDEEMIQRKSQAYDDVENFPNKFTAEYIFLINQSNSVIPRINQGSRERKKELCIQWNLLRERGQQLIEDALPEYNKALWNAGIGAIRLN